MLSPLLNCQITTPHYIYFFISPVYECSSILYLQFKLVLVCSSVDLWIFLITFVHRRSYFKRSVLVLALGYFLRFLFLFSTWFQATRLNSFHIFNVLGISIDSGSLVQMMIIFRISYTTNMNNPLLSDKLKTRIYTLYTKFIDLINTKRKCQSKV